MDLVVPNADQTFWIVASVALYCVVAIVIAFKLYVVKRATLIDPIVHFVFFLSLFTLPLPIRLIFTDEIEGNISPYLNDFSGYIPISVFFCACSLIVFYMSYYSRLPVRFAEYGFQFRTTSAFGAISASILIAIVSLLLLSILAAPLGGLGQFILLGYGSTKETFGSGYLAVGLPWLFVAVMFVFMAYAITRRKLWFLVGSIALVANIGVHLVMGNRSMVLYILICFGTFYLVQIKYLRWRTLLILGLALFLFLNVVGMTRKSDYRGFDDFVAKSLDSGSTALSHSNHGLFYTLTIGEFVVPFETLPQMIRTVGFEHDPQLGLSYLQSPLFLIPSAIFPDRPLPLTNWYMEEFYGQSGNYNEGRAFFFLAEAYLNFGPFGIILISIVWGVGWRALFEWLKRSEFDPGAALLYALALGFMFRCIAGTFATLLSGLFQQSLSIALVGLVLSSMTVRGSMTRSPVQPGE